MGNDDIRPFTISVPDEVLTDLRDRLHRTRWPEGGYAKKWDQGIPPAYLREVCTYWADEYDWRASEARMNALPQYLTTIDGVDIHFFHVVSPHADATPMILTHGWPGSYVEYLKVIGPLTNPTAYGGSADDAFHVVVPSIPGFAFSGKPTRSGWDIPHVAKAWTELMDRLGYARYVSSGTDWGATVAAEMGLLEHPDRLIGLYLNFAFADPEKYDFGPPTNEENGFHAVADDYFAWENGYSVQQSTRPLTLAHGLSDSPAFQAAWVIEKFGMWADCDREPESVFTRDELIDNVMTYWVNDAGLSSARIYFESYKWVHATIPEVASPTAYTAAKDLFRYSERELRTRFSDLRYYGTVDVGGHFLAFEQPASFVDEARAALRSFST
ncbi:epoxide hydrolase [Rhodococcus sp. WS4]|nr:epoxide hydrolase [Rhodococcus sp. WS4]